jgi:hypothetical protein
MSSSALRLQLEDVLSHSASFLCPSGFCLKALKLTWLLHAASEIEFRNMEIDLDISFVKRSFSLLITSRLSPGTQHAGIVFDSIRGA